MFFLSKPQTIISSVMYLGFIFMTINSINELNKVLIKTEKSNCSNFPIIVFNISVLTFCSVHLIKTYTVINQLY